MKFITLIWINIHICVFITYMFTMGHKISLNEERERGEEEKVNKKKEVVKEVGGG